MSAEPLSRSHRLLVRGLEDLGPVKVGDQEYDGLYLSAVVSINVDFIGDEAAKSPQLIYELGRVVARAEKDRQILEARYRYWRDSQILKVITDPEEAESEGLTDGAKVATKAAAELWVRTLDEYIAWWERMAHAEEAHSTVYAAMQAALQRKDALFNYHQSGVDTSTAGGVRIERPHRYTGEGVQYDTDVTQAEAKREVAAQERTPLPGQAPPTPLKAKGPPPPPRPPPMPDQSGNT